VLCVCFLLLLLFRFDDEVARERVAQSIVVVSKATKVILTKHQVYLENNNGMCVCCVGIGDGGDCSRQDRYGTSENGGHFGDSAEAAGKDSGLVQISAVVIGVQGSNVMLWL
jgi:hypothetical protein